MLVQIAKSEVDSERALQAVFAQENRDVFQRFINDANRAMLTILRVLSDQCALEADDRFEASHRDNLLSRSTLAMFRYPKHEATEVAQGHGKHTDLGTLTFLLCRQWGLQVLRPGDGCNNWKFVPPRADCAIVNVGDALRCMSGRRFRSAIHRVVPVASSPPTKNETQGPQRQAEDRFSIAYFLRPEDGAMYEDSLMGSYSAREWHDLKFNVFRQDHETQEQEPFLTGGMERDGNIVR